jgi:Pyruvate/2-oxoacid:ferredoxin oxidoreductase delta subunit
LKGIFAGGDVASMERFVSHALGMGMHAAKQMDYYLQNKSPENDQVVDKTVDMEVINTYYYKETPREQQDIVPVEDRLNNFDEVQLELTPQEAHAETQRCFSCGNCIFCDNCYYYCPDMAVVKLERGYSIRTDYCKGCGLCVKECPTGSIAMRDE